MAMKTQPTDAYRAFRECQRGGARKFSLLIVMCNWLMKTKNQDLSQYLRSLEGISLLYQKSAQNTPREWKARGTRIENTKEEKITNISETLSITHTFVSCHMCHLLLI